jgi:hypothetical protein
MRAQGQTKVSTPNYRTLISLMKTWRLWVSSVLEYLLCIHDMVRTNGSHRHPLTDSVWTFTSG